jgi:PAS domain S-box-containing protein/putative nucleotidyltransferase with HDIG domain
MKRFTISPKDKIALYYGLFSAAWVIVTDLAVDPATWLRAPEQLVKGLFFVLVTTVLLRWLLSRHSATRNRAEQERDDAVETYTTLFEQHGLPQMLINPATGQIVKANESAAAYYGWSESQLCAMNISDINVLTEAEIFAEMADARLQRRNHFKFCHRLSSGEIRDVEVYSHPVRLKGQALLYSIIVDVSKRQRYQLALERSNRLLKSFVSSARAIMRYHDKQGIADAVTRALVEEGQYAMVWIGLVPDKPSDPVQVFSQWGDTHHYLDNLIITWDNTKTSEGPTGRAIKSGQPQWVNDVAIDQRYQLWRQAALNSQFRSSATFPLLQGGRVFAVLNLYAYQPHAFDPEEVDYLEALAADLARSLVTIDSVREFDRVNTERLAAISRSREALFEAVAVLSDTVEIRDPYTAGHQRRVAWLAVAIGKELNLPEEKLETLRVAALLHDIGKIAVPAELLAKPGRLSRAEFELIKEHPQVGEALLKKVSFEAPIASIVGQHHERLDGTGYPQGLSAEQILPESRILAVADVVEAMISHRPYRPGLSLQTACQELQRGRGTCYDSTVVDACLTVMEQGGYEFLGQGGEPFGVGCG